MPKAKKFPKALSAEEAIDRLRVAQTALFSLSYDMAHPKSDRSWSGEIDSHAIVLLKLIEQEVRTVRGEINQAVHDKAAEEAAKTREKIKRDRQEKDTFTANN